MYYIIVIGSTATTFKDEPIKSYEDHSCKYSATLVTKAGFSYELIVFVSFSWFVSIGRIERRLKIKLAYDS